MTTPWKAVFMAESTKQKKYKFSNFGGSLQRFSVFSKFGGNEPKGPYFGLKWSNKPKIMCYLGEMADCSKKQ